MLVINQLLGIQSHLDTDLRLVAWDKFSHKNVGQKLRAIADTGMTLGYSGEELRQFVHDERMRMNKEKEQEIQHKEREVERQRKEAEAEIQRKEKEIEKQREINENEMKDDENLSLRNLS